MVLPAPGRFSTTICWPSARVSRTPMTRQMMSGVPPAACVTIILIGRVGQSSARASWRASPAPPASAASAPTTRMTVRLVECFIFPALSASRRHHDAEHPRRIQADDLVLVGLGQAGRLAHELDRLPFADRIVGAEDYLARAHP